MESTQARPANTLRFSLEALPDSGQLSALRDHLVEMMRTEVSAVFPDAPFRYASGLRIVPGAVWGSARSSAVVTTRTGQLTRDGQDDLMLVMPDSDMIVRAPGLGEIVVHGGDALLVSQARESQIILQKPVHSWAVRVPHRDLARLVPRLGAAPLMAIRRGTPMLSLLAQYGRLLEAEPLADMAAQELAGRHLREMLALVIGAAPGLEEEAETGSLAPMRLRTIAADIAEHLGDTNLSLEWIAARQGISTRHVQRLLARRGMNFSDLLRESRVRKARALLEDPRHAHRSIVAIALECGFPEASALNRSFRRHFGMTPSEARAMAAVRADDPADAGA